MKIRREKAPDRPRIVPPPTHSQIQYPDKNSIRKAPPNKSRIPLPPPIPFTICVDMVICATMVPVGVMFELPPSDAVGTVVERVEPGADRFPIRPHLSLGVTVLQAAHPLRLIHRVAYRTELKLILSSSTLANKFANRFANRGS